jgi:hypothetical protein
MAVEQVCQYLKGLLLQPDPDSIPAQFAGRKVNFEDREADDFLRETAWWRGHGSTKFTIGLCGAGAPPAAFDLAFERACAVAIDPLL